MKTSTILHIGGYDITIANQLDSERLLRITIWEDGEDNEYDLALTVEETERFIQELTESIKEK